ncbi:hypothetical protein SAMN05444392_101492 [Seinonella peptonophila]|uniref:Probable membrane transporter protein n=1 Tax=Seinonella peptonophila TaxID=112248 RepID=A0A1M4TJ21_9BACL|nr:sulfite exporter TauE/SafE family protein [Seinonella peptonophila]SHE44502.1 hypothetical protein SAMN05444392_101492 [Seinonella peptonophila]
MERLIILAVIGLIAQLIDGSLGMAYGVTTTSLLFLYGFPVALASASVHIAEVFTTAASGISHIRFGNVDKKVIFRLIIPGSIGAFGGAIFVSSLPGDMIKPYVSAFLLLLGIYVLIRFLYRVKIQPTRTISSKILYPLGLIAGFADATGGGGWGPITTPILLSRNQMEPRKVIGSVDTSEFAVASSASIGFLLSLGFSHISWLWVSALIAGGILAAPIAAWLVHIMPARILGVLVGGIIIVTNLKTLLETFSVEPIGQWTVYSIAIVIWFIALAYSIIIHRRTNSEHGSEKA